MMCVSEQAKNTTEQGNTSCSLPHLDVPAESDCEVLAIRAEFDVNHLQSNGLASAGDCQRRTGFLKRNSARATRFKKLIRRA
jgi:hypothetical protein